MIKKIILFALIIMVLLSIGTTVPPINAQILKGDINFDGNIDIEDLLLLKKYILKIDELTVNALIAADMNDDGEVDVEDLLILKKIILELIDQPTIENSSITQTTKIETKPSEYTGTHDIEELRFKNIEEFKYFINYVNVSKLYRTSPYFSFDYKKMIEIVRDRGYLIDIYYKGKSMEELPERPGGKINNINFNYIDRCYEDGNVAPWDEGYGYRFHLYIGDNNYLEINIYYLSDEDAEDAEDFIYLYRKGKYWLPPQEHEFFIPYMFEKEMGNKIIKGYSASDEIGFFLYEKCIVKIKIIQYTTPVITFSEFAADLTFEKVPLS